jgi:hypothetical protein
MTSTSGGVTRGTFQLWFSTEAAAFGAAREVRTRGFMVDVACVAAERWTMDARLRSILLLGELERYASRLMQIAAARDGTYVGFTAD